MYILRVRYKYVGIYVSEIEKHDKGKYFTLGDSYFMAPLAAGANLITRRVGSSIRGMKGGDMLFIKSCVVRSKRIQLPQPKCAINQNTNESLFSCLTLMTKCISNNFQRFSCFCRYIFEGIS